MRRMLGVRSVALVSRSSVAGAECYAVRRDARLTRPSKNHPRHIVAEAAGLAISPAVRGLTGIIPSDLGIADYREHTERKYGGARGTG